LLTELAPHAQSPVTALIPIPEGHGKQLYPSLLTAF